MKGALTPRALVARIVPIAWRLVCCAVLAASGALALAQDAGRAGAAPLWSAAQAAGAEPVWPAGAVPAGLTAVPLQRLDSLRPGMSTDAVAGLLGAPHGSVKAEGDAGTVWQYVIRDSAADRAFIASLWFDKNGLWRASGRSRPVGRLGEMQFGAEPVQVASASSAAPRAAPLAPPPSPAPVATATPAPGAAPIPTPAITATAPASPATESATPIAPPLVAYPKQIAAAPVAARPPAVAAAAAAEGPGHADVPALKQMLNDWLADWSRRDVSAYFSHYAPGDVAEGKPREEWQRARSERIKQARFIRVAAEQVQVREGGSPRPQLVFTQRYESDRYKEHSRKVLTLVKQGGRWLIEREENSPLPP